MPHHQPKHWIKHILQKLKSLYDFVTKPFHHITNYHDELKTRLVSFVLFLLCTLALIFWPFIEIPSLSSYIIAYTNLCIGYCMYFFFARYGHWIIVTVYLVVASFIGILLHIYKSTQDQTYDELQMIRDLQGFLLLISYAQCLVPTWLLSFIVVCILFTIHCIPKWFPMIEYLWFDHWETQITITAFIVVLGSYVQNYYYNFVEKQLVSNISHELRNPLHAIISATELLKDCDANNRRELLNTVLHSSKDMLELVKDILDFSKLRSGDLRIIPTKFNLKEQLHATVNSIKHLAAAKKLELSIDLQKDLPSFVIGDYRRIRQILLNLLSNAIKFTDHGFVRLRVTHSKQSDKYTNLTFYVEDSGCGIHEKDVRKLFQRFVQLDRTKPGTGLGLMICRDLAKLMGGSVSVKSTYQKGSVFTFSIKLKIAKTQKECQPNKKIEQTEKFEKEFNFLLAEDNALIQQLTKHMISSMGGKVFITNNGKECFEEYLSNHEQYSGSVQFYKIYSHEKQY